MLNSRLKLSESQKGVIVLVILSLVYATMGIFVRYLSTSFGIFQQIYLRMFSGFLLSLVIFNRSLDFRKLKKITSKEWLILIFRSFAFYILGVNLFTRALLLTKYGNVSFIGSLPLVALFGFILFKEKFSVNKALLIALAFVGAVLMAVQDYSNLLNWNRGDLFALISAAAFSLAYVTRKWHSSLLTNKEITTLILFIGSILLFSASLLSGETLPLSGWGPSVFLVVLAAGLFNVINNFLSQYGFEKVKAVLASNILTLESPFAVLIGFILYAEIPSLRELIGGLLILVSVLLMNKVEAKDDPG